MNNGIMFIIPLAFVALYFLYLLQLQIYMM